MLKAFSAATLVSLALMPAALAQGHSHGASGRLFDGEIEFSLQVDRLTQPGAARRTSVFGEIDAHFDLHLGEGLSIEAAFAVEPVREPTRSGWFQGEGGYIEDLNLLYQADPLTIRVGKFHSNFGTAWDKAPGIYGTEFAEDYELTERLGAAVSYKLETLLSGTHELTFNLFTVDTSVLSNSVGARPEFGLETTTRAERTRRWHGGAGNTGRLDSVALHLDGGDIHPLPGFSYHLGLRRQPKGVDGVADETGYVAAVAWEIKLPGEIRLTPLVEYAHFEKFRGLDQSARYVTGAASLGWEAWTLSASTTLRRIDDADPAAPDSRDWLRTATIAYAFTEALEGSLGWARARTEGETATTLGALLTYKLEF